MNENNENENENENHIKCVFLGDSGVGKTRLLNKFVYNGENYVDIPTTGASFLTKKITINSQEYNLMIWDVAGQQRFRGLAPIYYRNARIVYIVFDITNLNSYRNTASWLHELEQNGHDNDMSIFLVGNKCDLEGERVVFEEMLEAVRRASGILYYETSAITGNGINELFQQSLSNALGLTVNIKGKKLDSDTDKTMEKCC